MEDKLYEKLYAELFSRAFAMRQALENLNRALRENGQLNAAESDFVEAYTKGFEHAEKQNRREDFASKRVKALNALSREDIRDKSDDLSR